MPKVSVIFPMYNVSAYVKDSVTSVLNQTFRDFELIAVNDGSTDNTEAVFEETTQDTSDITIKLIKKENGGLADARNAALDIAEGEYIVFVDSDDVIHPKYLEVLMDDAKRFDTDASFSSFKYVDSKTLFDFEDTFGGELIDKQELMRLLLPRKKFLTACWCMLVKKSLLDKNKFRFNKQVKFSVDRAFIWKVIDVSNRISINYSQLYHYYPHEGSIMTATKKENLLSGVENFSREIRSLENLPFDSEILIDRWKLGVLHSSAKLLSFDEFRSLREEIGFSYQEAMKIPTSKSKLFCTLGIVSEKTLYTLFVKY